MARLAYCLCGLARSRQLRWRRPSASPAGGGASLMRCLLPAALALLAASPALGQEVPVDLELVLAVDISGSVDQTEANQQRQGYVAALADPAVARAIRSSLTGRVAVTYVEWAGDDMQEVVVPWTVL